jgi:hypothetical protein
MVSRKKNWRVESAFWFSKKRGKKKQELQLLLVASLFLWTRRLLDISVLQTIGWCTFTLQASLWEPFWDASCSIVCLLVDSRGSMCAARAVQRRIRPGKRVLPAMTTTWESHLCPASERRKPRLHPKANTKNKKRIPPFSFIITSWLRPETRRAAGRPRPLGPS